MVYTSSIEQLKFKLSSLLTHQTLAKAHYQSQRDTLCQYCTTYLRSIYPFPYSPAATAIRPEWVQYCHHELSRLFRVAIYARMNFKAVVVFWSFSSSSSSSRNPNQFRKSALDVGGRRTDQQVERKRERERRTDRQIDKTICRGRQSVRILLLLSSLQSYPEYQADRLTDRQTDGQCALTVPEKGVVVSPNSVTFTLDGSKVYTQIYVVRTYVSSYQVVSKMIYYVRARAASLYYVNNTSMQLSGLTGRIFYGTNRQTFVRILYSNI